MQKLTGNEILGRSIMTLDRVKLALIKMDEHLLKGNVMSFYSCHFKYRRKAYLLTKEFFFPPHTSSNKSLRIGPAGELLAIGGDLNPDRMILAFKNGISPLFSNNQPILWWTSEIRCILYPKDIHISKIMRQFIMRENFHLTVDKAFFDVVSACSESRKDFIWLTPERMEASFKLHELGIAHSVEVWQDQKLVGGLYGVSFGSIFFAESMFTRVTHTSKLALIALSLRLKELNYSLVDLGFWPTDHLKSMGAVVIQRDEYLEILEQSVQIPDIIDEWGDLFENWDFISAVKKRVSEENPKATFL